MRYDAMFDPTLRGLRVFEAAAAACSFSRGAEVMGMTQSAVSQQIRQMEVELGKRLFDTQARPIQLTDAGRELLHHARTILAQVNIAVDAMGSLDGQFTGLLHLGAVSPANYFTPRLMAAFRARFPRVRMKLTVASRDVLLTLLAERRVDLVIGGFPPAHADIEAEAFARHPHCLVASASHRLAGQRGLPWNELRDEPFIFREAGSSTRLFLEHLLQAQGLRFNAGVELQGNETVKQAVIAGMGISFLSAHVFQGELRAGLLKVLDVEGLPRWLDWCVLQSRDRVLSDVQFAFREFVLKEGAGLVACELGTVQLPQALPA